MNLKTLRIPNNYILVKPDKDFETFVINGKDTGIFIGDAADSKDISSDKSEHGEHATTSGAKKAVTGKVIKVCDNLIFNGEKLQNTRKGFSNDMAYMKELSRIRQESVTFDVPMELQEGDDVIFDYVVHYDCYSQGLYLEIDGEDYFFIKYDQLYARYDQDGVYPLNGKVFVEAVEREKEFAGDLELVRFEGNKGFDTVQYIKGKKLQIGRIVTSGCICKGYIDDPGVGDDRRGLDNGDYVAFKWAYATPFQSEMHKKFFPNKKILVLNRKDLALYIPSSNINQLKIA